MLIPLYSHVRRNKRCSILRTPNLVKLITEGNLPYFFIYLLNNFLMGFKETAPFLWRRAGSRRLYARFWWATLALQYHPSAQIQSSFVISVEAHANNHF